MPRSTEEAVKEGEITEREIYRFIRHAANQKITLYKQGGKIKHVDFEPLPLDLEEAFQIKFT